MEKLKPYLKKEEEKKFSPGLHRKILKNIFFIKYRKEFGIGALVFLVLVLLASQALWQKMAENDFIQYTRIMLEDWQMDLTIVKVSLAGILEEAPLPHITLVLLCGGIATGLGFVYYKYNRLVKKI